VKLLLSVLSLFSALTLGVTGCATVAEEDAAPAPATDESELTSCCVSARNGNDCWRKCDGRWKDLLSNETCSLARGDGGCVAEFRSGGGCWRKCNGRWKDLLPSEELCRVTACGATPPPDPNADCCVSARNGNDCWRKCDGRWKDLLSNETCSLARGDGGCVAEFRSGGGCWRKCNGRWKDLLPSEELCQVKACGTTPPPPPPGPGGSVTLHTFTGCDDFFTVATLTAETNCSDIFQSVRSVKKDGVCTEIPFGTSGAEACRQYKPQAAARTELYGLWGCSQLLGTAASRSECSRFSTFETVRSIRQNGACRDVESTDAERACLLYAP
jgi:hypothetical protein